MPSLPDIAFTLGGIDRSLWQGLAQETPVALQQHWAYGETLQAISAAVQQLNILVDGNTVGLALVGQRRFYGLIRLNSLMRGPLWTGELDSAARAAVFRALRRHFNPWRWNFMAFQPELEDTADNQGLLKQAGYRRVMTGYSTIWCDLAADTETLRASLNAKWRNQLKSAEGSTLEITVGGRKQHQYAWLLEKETAQQKTRGYQGIPTGLVPIYASIADRFAPDDPSVGVMSVSAIAGRKKVAGAVFLLHGNSATYHIGWSGDDGRRMNAQNRVLWEGMLALKERGIRFLDMGGINTGEGAGIARFKLGLGAKPVTLVGTWL